MILKKRQIKEACAEGRRDQEITVSWSEREEIRNKSVRDHGEIFISKMEMVGQTDRTREREIERERD